MVDDYDFTKLHQNGNIVGLPPPMHHGTSLEELVRDTGEKNDKTELPLLDTAGISSLKNSLRLFVKRKLLCKILNFLKQQNQNPQNPSSLHGRMS